VTATRAAAPAGTGADGTSSESCSCQCTSDISRRLASLPPESMELLAYWLREEASRRRRRLTVSEAAQAIDAASPPEWWLRGRLGMVKRAACELTQQGWHPSSFVDALLVAGREAASVDLGGYAVAYAIAAGVEYAIWLRSGDLTVAEERAYEACDELRRRCVAEYKRGRDVAAA
jgi:hypothetical protein